YVSTAAVQPGEDARLRTNVIAHQSEAAASAVRPFLLNRVLSNLLGLPSANVSNLAVLVVVPSLAGYWVGDGLAQFMRSGNRECLKARKTGRATGTPGEGHHGVKFVLPDGVVVSAEHLA